MSEEARRSIENILTWQTPIGGWAKGYDLNRKRAGDEAFGTWDGISTIDNGATYSELRLLGRYIQLKPDARVQAAFIAGLDALLLAQYPSGGWPQRFPPPAKNYGRHITFNDGAMVGVMRLLRDVAQDPKFAFVDERRRTNAKAAFKRGIDCILRCQIIVNGQPTGWCAQHDPVTFEPVGARAYELPSLSGSEGADVVRLLMELPEPDDHASKAIAGAATWFQSAKIPGKRIDEHTDPTTGRRSLLLVNDATSVIWARFYDLRSGRPFFVDRDGHVLEDYSQLPLERRDGYRWYGSWGKRVLDEYEQWQIRHPVGHAKPTRPAQGNVWDVTIDGKGAYATVQAAIDAIHPAAGPTTIRIGPGTYRERLSIDRTKGHLTLVGDGMGRTILTYDLNAKNIGHDGKPVGTSGSASVTIDADDFSAQDIAFENSAGDVGQAVAMKITGDRVAFRRCRFVGWQDTLCADSEGRNYFVDCEIEGRVDFIFGRSTAVFERCRLTSKNGGYVTAASTAAGKRYGYVFIDCTLTGDGAPAYLGRPWRPHASVTFVRCDMRGHIRPEGWDDWRKPENQQTARFAEYRSTGEGAHPDRRVSWSRQLSDAEAAELTTAKILHGDDDWNPVSN